MIDFVPLVLEHKELFDSYMRGHMYMQSESSFANLYMWQHTWDIQIAEKDNALFLSFSNPRFRPFLMPPFLKHDHVSIEPYMRIAEDYMRERYGELYIKCAASRHVEKIRQDCGSRYFFRYDQEDSDYVYYADALMKLSGKKYHGKRNHINAFLKNYSPDVRSYSPEYKDGCLLLQEEWARARDAEGQDADEEYISIMKALDNFDALELRGIVVLLDDKVAAFTIGEQLNPETALVHIEKAHADVNGLFPYINQQFVERDWADCRYVNREEDMGVPGIRQAKQSYHPAFLVDKFDVIQREGH